MKMVRYFLFWAALFGIATPGQAAYQAGTRAVYYNGELRYVSLRDGDKVGYYSKVIVPGSWTGPWADTPQAELSLPSGWKRQDPDYQKDAPIGEGIVIFREQLIHFAVVLTSSDAPQLVMSRVDLNRGDFVLDNPDERVVTQLCSMSKLNTYFPTYGVAATVFDNKVYVFTNQFTLVSDDGANYRRLQTASGGDIVLAGGLSGYNALDAVTFYPSGDGQPAKIMVLWGAHDDPNERYHGAAYVIWDGQEASLPLAESAVRFYGNDAENRRGIGGGALAIGTAGDRYDDPDSETFPPGLKKPVIQVFTFGYDVTSNAVMEWYLWRHEYDIDTDTLVEAGKHHTGHPILRLRVYPWYLTEPDASDPTRVWTRQLIVVNSRDCKIQMDDCKDQEWKDYPLISDYMAPVDKNPTWGWDGTPTATQSSEPTLQSYWSLIGVVLGPAPFAINDREDFEVQETSNVIFGQSEDEATEQSDSRVSTVMASSATEIKAGLSKEAGMTVSLDLGYKHAWETAHGHETETSQKITKTLGTDDELSGGFGLDGWALFSCPTLLVQEHAFYAYDRATYLGQGLYTIVQGSTNGSGHSGLALHAERFSLTDPSLSDPYPGLMAGMQPFPESTDLPAWSDVVWEDPGQPWTVVFGSGQSSNGGSLVNRVQQGDKTTIEFAKTETDVSSVGETTSVSIEGGVAFGAKTKLSGFKQTLTAGYESEWSTEVTTTTAISKSLEIEYHLPVASSECKEEDPDCVTTLVVQPYLLQATNGGATRAPWIPDTYKQDLPWAIAWQVVKYQYADGRSGGLTAPPALAQGTVAGVAGATGGASTYRVDGGHLAWLGPDGRLGTVPMSADDFDPVLGAAVRIRDLLLSADPAQGTWNRNGALWSYNTHPETSENAFNLVLDFGRGTWSFSGSALDLAEQIPAGDRVVRIELTLNDRFAFFSVVPHSLTLDWQLAAEHESSEAVEITAYSGQYASATETGAMHLAGTLPAHMTAFGDLSLVTNRHQVDIPLLAHEEFNAAMAHSGSLVYEDDGINVVVDLGRKTWSADFSGNAFDPRMAARRGGARIGLKLGGAPQHDAEHPIVDFSTMLDFACVAGTPATDFRVFRRPPRLNHKTGYFEQSVTLINRSGQPIDGPVSLALDRLSANATLINKTGSTICSLPAGSAYIDVDIGSDNVLGVGESAKVTLQFINSRFQRIVYGYRVLHGAGTR